MSELQNDEESPTINVGSDDSDEYQTPSEMLTEASACDATGDAQ